MQRIMDALYHTTSMQWSFYLVIYPLHCEESLSERRSFFTMQRIVASDTSPSEVYTSA